MRKTALFISIAILITCLSCASLQLNEQQLLNTTLESGAFLLGNLGAKQHPIPFAAAAEIGKRALNDPLWSLAFTEHSLNDIWCAVQPSLSADPAMLHLAKKWLNILEYDSSQNYITVPEEYITLVRNGISEFVFGVELALK